MNNQFDRTQMLLDEEALARSGVGALDLIDKDVVDETNINRQIIATLDTVGRPKVDVAEERVQQVGPNSIQGSGQL